MARSVKGRLIALVAIAVVVGVSLVVGLSRRDEGRRPGSPAGERTTETKPAEPAVADEGAPPVHVGAEQIKDAAPLVSVDDPANYPVPAGPGDVLAPAEAWGEAVEGVQVRPGPKKSVAAALPEPKADEPVLDPDMTDAVPTQTVGPILKLTYSNGTEVELLGVAPHPSKGALWWHPDGSLMPQAPYEKLAVELYPPGEADKGYEMLARFTAAPPDDVDVRWQVGGQSAECSFPWVEERERPNLWRHGRRPPYEFAGVAVLPGSIQKTSVSIGIAGGQWETIDRAKSSDRTDGLPTAEGRVYWQEAREQADGKVTRGIMTTVRDRQCRVIAIDKNGKVCVGTE